MKQIKKLFARLLVKYYDWRGDRVEERTYLGNGDFTSERGWRINGKFKSAEEIIKTLEN